MKPRQGPRTGFQQLTPIITGLMLALTNATSARVVDHSMGARFERGNESLRAPRESIQRSTITAVHGANATRGPTAIVVENCNDDGSGSLRASLANAINGDTLDLTALSCSTITLTSGALVTNLNDLNMLGPGAEALSLSGNGTDRVLYHAGYGTLAVSGVTLSDGNFVADSYEAGRGGCLNSQGNVELDHVVMIRCSVTAYAAYGAAASVVGDAHVTASTISLNTLHGSRVGIGGSLSTQGALFVSGSNISSNTVDTESIGYGAIANGAAMSGLHGVTITDSVVTGNVSIANHPYPAYSASAGNIVFAYLGTLTLIRSVVSGNNAHSRATGSSASAPSLAISYGGGLRSPMIVVSDSTIDDNSTDAYAINSAGTAYAYSKGGGLATFGAYGSVSVTNSTISGNVSTWEGDASTSGFAIGGGLFSWGYAPVVSNSTIAFNQAEYGGGVFLYATTSMTCNSSIVAANVSATDLMAGGGTTTIDGSNNFFGSVDTTVVSPADTLFGDPQLAPLADNGGPTRTHALLSESPAIDAGNNLAGLDFDQRGTGYSRTSGVRADIGAFELQVAADTIFQNGFEGS